jgi:Ca2+-binding EF-hand superfamily protein
MKFSQLCFASAAGAWLSVASAGADSASSAAVEHEMRMMDADHDGKVSAEEHAAGTRQMFLKMDADGDGKVTAAEMDASQQAITGRPSSAAPMSSARKIRVIDADHDGQLTAQEHAEGSQRMFGVLDTDDDQQLTLQELEAGHEQMMGTRKY